MQLTDEQRKIIEYPDSCFILATAGSGKTTTISLKIEDIKRKNPDSKILYITFTRKARAHAEKKLEHLKGVRVTNYHSLCYQLLVLHKRVFKLNEVDIVSDSYCYSVLEGLFTSFSKKDIKDALKVIRKVKYNETPLEKMSPAQKAVYLPFQNTLSRQKKFTYADLLLVSNKLFAKGQINDVAMRILKYDYIFLDEQQDNYFGEFKFIENLMSINPGCVITGVGDLFQSIMGFTEADPTLCLDFMNRFNTKVFTLSYNFRSQENIINLGNDFLGYLSEFSDFKTEMKPTIDPRSNVSWNVFGSLDYQYAYVCEEIRKIVNSTRYNYSDFYVLFRCNKSGVQFEKFAVQYGIPFELSGGSFLSRKVVYYLITLIKMINYFILEEEEELSSLLKVFVKEMEKDIANKTYKILVESHPEVPFMKKLEHVFSITLKGIGKSRKTSFYNIYKKVQTIKEKAIKYKEDGDIEELISFCKEFVMDFKFYKSAPIQYKEGIEEDADILFDIFRGLEGGLHDRLNQILIDFNDRDKDKSEKKVLGLTIHKAKGLENKAIFIVDFDQIPPFWMDLSDKALEEEKRIAYVAVTRAENMLYITSVGDHFEFAHILEGNSVVDKRFVS